MKITYKLKNNHSTKWQLYSFTTENIAGYLNEFNFEKKSVLTVAGSGDHILNAILLGSLNITAFDINANALYFSELKLVMAKNLSYQQFLDFFMINSKNALNFDIFSKFCNNLSNFSKDYFLKLYEEFNFDGYKLRHSNHFNNKYDKQNLKIKYNIYLTRENFNKLKQTIDKATITYIESDIKTLQLARKYDIVLLSNISDYLSNFGENQLQNYFNTVLSLKSSNNIVVFGYVYDINSSFKRSEIDDKNLRSLNFGNSKYKYEEKEFDSAIETKTDCILILKGEI